MWRSSDPRRPSGNRFAPFRCRTSVSGLLFQAATPSPRGSCSDWTSCATEPFILYPRANGSVLYDSIIAACQSAGFSPRVVQEAPQMASMVSLVAAGVGVTLVPESVCQLRPAGVRYVRINGQAPVAMLWLVAQRSATASAIDNFLRHAATFFKRRAG